MKKLFVVAVAAVALLLVHGAFAQNGTTGAGTGTPASETRTPSGCAACAQKLAPETVSTGFVPGTSETMLVGRIENLIPIGVLAALGCERCASAAVVWALEQGSSIEDVDRTLRTLAAMQTLDCFKQQFGNDAPARLEKPLTAARQVLQQAIDRRAGR
jgi:hypothetical protein